MQYLGILSVILSELLTGMPTNANRSCSRFWWWVIDNKNSNAHLIELPTIETPLPPVVRVVLQLICGVHPSRETILKQCIILW